MNFIYKDGDPVDTQFTFEILNWKEAHFGGSGPWVDIEILLTNKDFHYEMSRTIYDYELIELLEKFENFENGKIKSYIEWYPAEQSISFLFNPELEQVTMKIPFNYPWNHASGFYFDMFIGEDSTKFYKYLKKIIKP